MVCTYNIVTQREEALVKTPETVICLEDFLFIEAFYMIFIMSMNIFFNSRRYTLMKQSMTTGTYIHYFVRTRKKSIIGHDCVFQLILLFATKLIPSPIN